MINVIYDCGFEAQDDLKEGMTPSDYNTFKEESGINWGEDDIDEWEKFL